MNIGWWLQFAGGLFGVVSASLLFIGFIISPTDNIIRSIKNTFQIHLGSGDNVAGNKNTYNQSTFLVLEKTDEVNYEKLITKYPFGYLIFAIEKDKVKLIPGPMHLSDGYEINWNHAGVFKLTSDEIGINLPDIKFKQGGGIHNSGIVVYRVLNIPQRSPIQWNGIDFDLYVELLEDKDSRVILVLGLSKKQ